MANGVLGRSNLSAATDTVVYTAPAGKSPTVNVNICNRNNSAVTVRLAISTSTSPGFGDYIEYETTLPAYGVLERAGLVMSAGDKLIVRSSNTGVNAVAYGFED